MSAEPINEASEKIAENPKRKKVLVMDDEEIVRDVVGLMLYELGYEVSLSKDGEEAIERYRNEKATGESFDAVILDLNIQEGMGGTEACRRLLEIDPSATCIASSGYPVDLTVTDIEKYGFKGSIAKPYRLNYLDKILKEVL